MSKRVYTLLTPDQKAALENRALDEDRSESKIISRALDRYLGSVSPLDEQFPAGAPKVKTFTRTTPEMAAKVKEAARSFDCPEWRVVNAAVTAYLANGDA